VRKRNIDWFKGVHCAVPRIRGGLGVHDLQVKNSAFLDKWLFKLLTEDRALLKRKYIREKALSQILWKPGDWWRGVDDVNDRPVGNPKRRCDEHNSKFSLSKKPRFINLVGKSQTPEGDAC
jgi:hypothetical protein